MLSILLIAVVTFAVVFAIRKAVEGRSGRQEPVRRGGYVWHNTDDRRAD